MPQFFPARETGIFVKQCRGWFNVNVTYCLQSVDLLQISIQIFVSLLFIIISKEISIDRISFIVN